MAKKPTLHRYSDEQAFQRLMLLIATLVKYPGIGCANSDEQGEVHHDALQIVQQKLQELAGAAGINLPAGYPATFTIRKDLETLRQYGILHQRMYRWGYYLGTGVMSREELQVAFHTLASAAKYQGNPQIRRVYQILTKRLRGLNTELQGEFFYPVRQHLNRAIVHTDPEEMRELGEYQDTLFHVLDVIEAAIIQGQAIEISRSSDPYSRGRLGIIKVYPLQLIYHDIAWYLIYEYCSNGQLAVSRVNRFKNYCKVLAVEGRGLSMQQKSLINAHKLLENGWGLYLGELEEQQAELQGILPLTTVKVRFFSPVTAFIVEGDRRHLHQKIHRGPKDQNSGQPKYLDYTVELPMRSLKEFILWVYRHMDNAKILAPPDLVEQQRQAAIALVNRFQ
jgi:predicted DNA-binding transcriptional regulator YafY